MKSAFPLAFLVGLFLCLNVVEAQDKLLEGQPDRPRQLKLETPDLSVSAELQELEDGTYSAKFDLGRIPAGLNAVVDLMIKNPFDKKINFSGVSKKCKCSNFRPDRYYFSPNEELKIRVRLKLPIRRNSKFGNTSLLIVNRDESVANLHFDYELEGMLSFTDLIGIIGFDSDNQTKTLDMPFIATKPVSLDNLSLIKTENLDGCKFEIIKQDEGGVVRITATDSVLTKSKIRGEVIIAEKDTKRRDTFFLTIKNDKLAQISPSVVTFKKNGSGLVATATLKMAKSIPDDTELDKIQLECLHNGTSVASKLKRLSDKLIQVVLTGEDKLAQSAAETAKLKWKVVHKGQTTNLETPFVVSD